MYLLTNDKSFRCHLKEKEIFQVLAKDILQRERDRERESA